MAVLDHHTSEGLEQLSGIVQRITFHSVESGYTVLKINSFQKPQEEVTVIVHQCKVFAGATLDFYGAWTTHPQYGLQFKATKVVERKPATLHGLEKYLGSGLIKGVGPVTAKKIVQHFGEQTLPVFDHQIQRLTEVPGIARGKLELIRTAWTEHQHIRQVMLFLQEHHLSTLFAVKIFKTYGQQAIEVVKNNPYRLAQDIYGIGFFSADKVALSTGLAPDSPQRLQAAIGQVLQQSREEGHCYLTGEQLLQGVTRLLSLQQPALITAALQQMEQQEELKIRLLPDAAGRVQKCYYAHSLYYDEQYIATKVQQLMTHSLNTTPQPLQQQIEAFCKQHRITLSDEQSRSVRQIATEQLSILTGGPGCGKTTTTRVLVGVLEGLGKKVLLAAPTGRAAQRLSEVIGREAKTLHRLLEWDPAKGGFKKGEADPLQTDVLMVDECSMLDVHLAAALLRAVPLYCQVVLIGDSDQLPAVGAGNVLKDLMASGVVPTHRLTQVFRQAAESLIITYAHQINQGEVPKVPSPFHRPQLWQQHTDCLFIDSEEATQEQLRFIARVKKVVGATDTKAPEELSVSEQAALYETRDSGFSLPARFSHVDVDALLKAGSYSQELMEVLRRVHPWSSLHYGYSAVAMIEKLYEQVIPKYWGKGVEVQILSPMTRGSLGTANLNQVIQETINPLVAGKAQVQVGGKVFRIGDRVMQRRNNYELGVFNGDIGTITGIDNEALEMLVRFPSGREVKEVLYQKEYLLELELAYAITIHKAQGSEFEAVIMPLVTQHFNMLFRNLVYTGLTRARKLAVMVGSRTALSMAIGKQQTASRQTALDYLLRQKKG